MESQVAQEEEQLKDFKVHPQYKEIENEVNELTFKIHELVNDNISDRRLLEYYEASLKEEIEAKPESVMRMFQEAGVVFPNNIAKRLNDVLAFHKQVVVNRKEFLTSEMDRIKRKMTERAEETNKLSSARAEKMQILQKHGALEEYTKLINSHQKKVAEMEELNIRLENLRKFEQGKNAIAIEQALLQQQAMADLNERKAQKEMSILLFNSNSKALYQVPGTLSIDVSKTGYRFNVTIERSGSHGISNMKIFCYDLMLAQIWAKKGKSPMFLIHDSLIFAEVDERQKALALELAAKESEKCGFQYICTFNSDGIPARDFSKSFKFEQYFRMILTDRSEDGGLLGIRF